MIGEASTLALCWLPQRPRVLVPRRQKLPLRPLQPPISRHLLHRLGRKTLGTLSPILPMLRLKVGHHRLHKAVTCPGTPRVALEDLLPQEVTTATLPILAQTRDHHLIQVIFNFGARTRLSQTSTSKHTVSQFFVALLCFKKFDNDERGNIIITDVHMLILKRS